MMSEFQLASLLYIALQAASLILLPKWWKAATLPSLLAVLGLLSRDDYLGDVFATLWLIGGCAYLLLVWVSFGATRLVQQRKQS